MTNSEVENHYADLRKEAIAFGEWLLEKGYAATCSLGTHVFEKPVWHFIFDSTGKTLTTEELYEEFIKSK